MGRISLYLSWLRVCARCGKGLWWRTWPVDLYCESCWAGLELIQNRSFTLLQDLAAGPLTSAWIYALFTWTPSSADRVKPLVYQLKGGGLPEAYRRLAENFSHEMNLAQDVSGGTGPWVFVVPPSRRSPSRDHARQWAAALARIWGGEVWDGLEVPARDAGSQKSKTRAERLAKRYVLGKPIPLEKTFVFVDDVMTSGATAEAVWRALKEPHCFQVWVIAYRPKLAGLSGIC